REARCALPDVFQGKIVGPFVSGIGGAELVAEVDAAPVVADGGGVGRRIARGIAARGLIGQRRTEAEANPDRDYCHLGPKRAHLHFLRRCSDAAWSDLCRSNVMKEPGPRVTLWPRGRARGRGSFSIRTGGGPKLKWACAGRPARCAHTKRKVHW